jgi:hypothetical protein
MRSWFERDGLPGGNPATGRLVLPAGWMAVIPAKLEQAMHMAQDGFLV